MRVSGRWRRYCSRVAFVAVFFTASACLANPAAQLYEQGRALFLEGFFERAIDRLQEARARADAPRQRGAIWLYLGLSYDGLGDAERARQAFITALTHDPTLELSSQQFKPAVVEQLKQIKAGMRGELRIPARVGVRVWVDGQPVGKLPFEDHVPVGEHRVEARRPDGTLLLDRKVIVHGGKRAEVELLLTPPLVPPPPPRRGGSLAWAWVGGAAVAAAAVALGLELGIRSRDGEAEGLLRGGLEERELQRLDDLSTSSDRLRLGATLSWSVAGACAVGSLILLLTSRQRDSRSESASGRLSFFGRLLALRFRY